MREKMTDAKKREAVIQVVYAVGGSFLFAFGVNVLITPLGLYNGGFMGIAQLIRVDALLHIPHHENVVPPLPGAGHACQDGLLDQVAVLVLVDHHLPRGVSIFSKKRPLTSCESAVFNLYVRSLFNGCPFYCKARSPSFTHPSRRHT